ncbi:MAG: FHA domain-containing protein [Deltaproteobacteria bacterium]|nr:FHA domain-containing protein [Deltaproteobacteria bacterium]
MAFIEVLNGSEVGLQIPVSKEVFFIGRDQNNHLVLSDRTVSRKHAVINLIEGNYTISDLESLRGVLLNGVKEKESGLKDGDEITLGTVRIYFFTGEMDQKTKRRKKKKRWGPIVLLFVFLTAAAGFYFNRDFLINLLIPPSQSEAVLKEHLERGILLYNEKGDIAGAKTEWEMVLEKDPKRKTIYAEKAAKLLEKL